MSGQLFRYEAVTAKCRCLLGRLMTREQYSALTSKRSFADAVAYLKESTAYSSVLDVVIPERVHRARIERLLEKHLLDAYVKLYTFTSGPERAFIGHLLEELEIRYLLYAIRATEYDDSMEFYSVPQFIRDHAKVDFSAIFATDSKDEILEALKGTEYYDTLSRAMSNPDNSFAQIEAEITRSYYRKLVTKYVSVFSGDQRERIQQALKTKIDLMNISVIIRMRRFELLRVDTDRVKLDFTTVLPLLMPYFGKLREADIIMLCSQELSVGETVSRFAEIYGKPADMFEERTSTGEYGSLLLYKQALGLAGTYKASFDVVFGYLSLLKFETDNIIYILEALRYGVPVAKIEQSIII